MKKVNIVGLSRPMICMVLDNLQSSKKFPEIKIINNLNLSPIEFKEFSNFEIVYLSELNQLKKPNSNFILGVNKPNNKAKIIKSLKLKSNNFLNVIHSNTCISSTTSIANGVVINSLVSIAHNSVIEKFVTINRNVSIGHDTKIGEYSTINPGANIAGFVSIGRMCQIGLGVNIIDNITIGENTIIGAGSLVTKDIPSNVIAYGNPCKIIRKNEI
jgi:sugar O-acyltransferase (sialic acid O-acetyltransferase NeuD family)